MGCAEGTVKAHLSRGTERLQEQLAARRAHHPARPGSQEATQR